MKPFATVKLCNPINTAKAEFIQSMKDKHVTSICLYDKWDCKAISLFTAYVNDDPLVVIEKLKKITTSVAFENPQSFGSRYMVIATIDGNPDNSLVVVDGRATVAIKDTVSGILKAYQRNWDNFDGILGISKQSAVLHEYRRARAEFIQQLVDNDLYFDEQVTSTYGANLNLRIVDGSLSI